MEIKDSRNAEKFVFCSRLDFVPFSKQLLEKLLVSNLLILVNYQ